MDFSKKMKILTNRLRSMDSALVAYSGGADSTLLLYLCSKHVGGELIAATAVSPLHAEADDAKKTAKALVAKIVEVKVDLLANPEFRMNPPDRCYLCKKTIFSRLIEIARERKLSCVLEGSNVNDLSEFRPGRRAIAELGVLSPFVEAGFEKSEIRELSREMGLETSDKPSGTCLATRFPYGTELTKEALLAVSKAEKELRLLIKGPLRVRVIGKTAKIEVSNEEIATLEKERNARRIAEHFASLGYEEIAVDPKGYRTGSMDESLADEERAAAAGEKS